MTPVQPNGTHARDIALRFFQYRPDERITSSNMGRTIRQAKLLLQNGYTKEQILNVIEYVVHVKRINMYSLGYISTTIDDMLKEIEEFQLKQKYKEMAESQPTPERKERACDEQSAERNRDKSGRFGIQSREREKYSKYLFEGQ